MNDWYQRMVAALQLNGKGEPTQKAYTRAVRMLSEFYDKTPDLISEPELQEYFLQRKNVNRWAPKTMRIWYGGIRFFYLNVLARDWHILSILRAQNEHRLPAVLSVEEVRSILAQLKTSPHHVFLSTVYSYGLRLDEARHLQVSDIDSQRMMIHVHRGKSAKDRYVRCPSLPSICCANTGSLRSCGNRHCPTCQYNKTQRWLEKQIQRQLPGHHFLITFTVPEQLRSFMRQHQGACYSALSKASSDAFKKLALDLPVPEVEPRRQSTCPSCGGLLKLRSLLPPLTILRRSG